MQCQILSLLCALFSLLWVIVIILSQTVNVFGSLFSPTNEKNARNKLSV